MSASDAATCDSGKPSNHLRTPRVPLRPLRQVWTWVRTNEDDLNRLERVLVTLVAVLVACLLLALADLFAIDAVHAVIPRT